MDVDGLMPRDALQSVNAQPRKPYTSEALAEMLRVLRLELGWNLRARRIERRDALHGEALDWRPFDDRIEADLREQLSLRFRLDTAKNARKWDPPDTKWKRIINAYLSDPARQHDPFLRWIGWETRWDGTPRVETLLADVLGADDDDFARWASRFLFCGPLLRACWPGAKLDETPVLVGPQGCGKSALIRSLVPVTEWHGDSLTLDGSPKEQAEAVAGRVLVEIPELAGSTRADIEKLKAFLTRTDDGQHRAAYARHAETSPRRAVFVGTANDTGTGVLPNDPSGNRRFVVIRTPGATSSVEATIEPILEQLWGEAHQRYRDREPGWADPSLPRRLHPRQRQANAEHRRSEIALQDKVADFCPTEAMTLEQIARTLDLHTDNTALPRRLQMALANELTAQAWTKTKTSRNGSRAWRWTHPDHPTTAAPDRLDF